MRLAFPALVKLPAIEGIVHQYPILNKRSAPATTPTIVQLKIVVWHYLYGATVRYPSHFNLL